jgi:hypothetical protein
VSTTARIADALDYAHGRGILHRDIKPGNILLEADGTPRLTDFGLALDLQASELTQTGEMFGSPLYMSPEQAFRSEQPVDARTDIYSLAVTLYELLLLRLPYQGTTHAELMAALSSGTIVPPRRVEPDFPEPLERVLVQALRTEPHERYATAATFAADLRAALERPEEVRAVAAAARARRGDELEEHDDIDEGWWRWIGGMLIIAGLAMFLGNGLTREALTFIGVGVALWVYETWTQRHAPSRPARSRRPQARERRRPSRPRPSRPAARAGCGRSAAFSWASSSRSSCTPAPGRSSCSESSARSSSPGSTDSACASTSGGQGEPHDRPLRGLIFEHSIERWMRALGITLIVAGLLLLLPDEPAVRATMVFVAAGAGLWLYDAVTHRNQLRERALARGEVPPPHIGEGYQRWRNERPVFSGAALGCGCLVAIALLLGPSRRSGASVAMRRRVAVVTTGTSTWQHGTRAASFGAEVLLERFRDLVVPYDLSFESVQPDQPLRAARVERRADYPSPRGRRCSAGRRGRGRTRSTRATSTCSTARAGELRRGRRALRRPARAALRRAHRPVHRLPRGRRGGRRHHRAGLHRGPRLRRDGGPDRVRKLRDARRRRLADGLGRGRVLRQRARGGRPLGRWVGREHGTLYIEGG